MVQHLAVVRGSIDSAVLTALTPITDPVLRIIGNDLYVPSLNKLGAIQVLGANVTLAQIVTQSLRDWALPDLMPVYRASAFTGVTPPLLYDKQPVQLAAGEPFTVQAAEDAAGASVVHAGLWFCDNYPAPVSGDIHTVRCTGTTNLVANTWTAVPLTFSQTLGVGRYSVVGMHAQSATALFARLSFVGGGWRPGVPALQTITDQGFPMFRRGNFGSFGDFDYLTPPQVEFYATAADAAEVVYLDLIRHNR